MRNKIFYPLALLTLVVFSGRLQAQDDHDDIHNLSINIPEVALLDLEAEGEKSVKLGPKAPGEAGNALDFSEEQNSDLWINYSSIVGSKTEPSRDITAQITSGNVPEGLVLSVQASKDAGMGDGEMGRAKEMIRLDDHAQEIITGVGSAYTGNGPSRGHQLTYVLSLDKKEGSYAKIDFDQSNTLAITYTLTDQ